MENSVSKITKKAYSRYNRLKGTFSYVCVDNF